MLSIGPVMAWQFQPSKFSGSELFADLRRESSISGIDYCPLDNTPP